MEALTIDEKELDKLNIPDEEKQNEPVPLRTVAPIEQIIHFADKGLSYTEIGRLISPDNPVSRSAICQRLKKIGYTPARLKHWKKSKADVLEVVSMNIAGALTDKDFKKESTAALATTFGILFDKVRLLEGKSTQNISSVTAHIIQELDDFKGEIGTFLESNGQTIDIEAKKQE